nr:MAG TPA: hypothetical protein [Caudoviricetes sp.]
MENDQNIFLITLPKIYQELYHLLFPLRIDFSLQLFPYFIYFKSTTAGAVLGFNLHKEVFQII